MSRAVSFLVGALISASALVPAPLRAEDSRTRLIAEMDRRAGLFLGQRAQLIDDMKTRAAAEARQKFVRGRLLALLGGLPSRDNPLAAQVTGRSGGEGFAVENVVFDALPGQKVTANLFLPAVRNGPVPAVIIAPGHGASGKLSSYAFAASFARNGIAALAYDIVDEGERMQYLDPVTGASRNGRVTGDHSAAAFPALMTGQPVARFFVNDAMRGVDYLASRPEIDAKRIGAFGCSGGGTVVSYLAALDPRIQATASACWVNDYAHLLATVGPQDAEQSLPGFLAERLDLADWVELAAPRPYAIVSTSEDMFPFAGAAAAVDEISRFWSLFGARDRVEWIHGPGGHGAIAPLGDRIIAFFRRSLAVEAPVIPFAALRPVRPEDVLVTPTGQLATSLGSVTLADIAAARARRPPGDEATDPKLMRRYLSWLAEGESPGEPVRALVAERPADGLEGDRVTLDTPTGRLDLRLLRPAAATGKPRYLLLLQPGPLASVAQPRGRMRRLAEAGWTVLAVEARGTDGSEEVKSEIVGNQNLLALRAMLVGWTLPGLRIGDVLRAARWLRTVDPDPRPAVLGIGMMAPVAMQAALAEPEMVEVWVENGPLSWRDAVSMPLARDLPANAIPGILDRYDLPDVARIIGPARLHVAAPVDPLGQPMRERDFRARLPGFAFNPYPLLP